MTRGLPLRVWIDPDGAVWIEDPADGAPALGSALAGPARAAGAPPPAAKPRFHALRPEALARRQEAARALARTCGLCAHACGVDRLAGERGRCGSGPVPLVGDARLHLGEEAAIAPSYALGLTGCTWHCLYCHVPSLVNGVDSGVPLGPAHAREAAASGAASLSFVGGNPDQHLPGILGWIAALPEDWGLPLVWNSNLYGAPALYALLDGVVDWHVADWRYGNDDCGARLSGVPDAATVAARNLALLAAGSAPLIVRVLVLPGHATCCALPAVAAIARIAPGARVNVMAQYHPAYRVAREAPELDRVTPLAEVASVRRAAREAGLTLVEGGKLHET